MPRTASADEIRRAFRKLAKQYHPDNNPGDKAAEERFKRVSAAFDLLGDEDKRKKFDAGEIDADGRETMRGFSGGNPFGEGGGFRAAVPRRPRRRGVRGRRPQRHPRARCSAARRRAAAASAASPSAAPTSARRLEIDLEEAINGAQAADRLLRRPHARRHHPQGRSRRPGAAAEGPGLAGPRRRRRRADRARHPPAPDLQARGRQPGHGPAGLGPRRGAGRQGRGADAGWSGDAEHPGRLQLRLDPAAEGPRPARAGGSTRRPAGAPRRHPAGQAGRRTDRSSPRPGAPTGPTPRADAPRRALRKRRQCSAAIQRTPPKEVLACSGPCPL